MIMTSDARASLSHTKTTCKMAKRTAYLSAERQQVYRSLACLSVQVSSENGQGSMGSNGRPKGSVFLRLGSMKSQASADCGDAGPDIARRNVFDRLADISAPQAFQDRVPKPRHRWTSVTSDKSALTSRCLVTNRRIAELSVVDRADPDSPCVDDLREKLDRLREAREQRKSSPRHLSPMVKFAQQQKSEETTVLDKVSGTDIPRVKVLRTTESSSVHTSTPGTCVEEHTGLSCKTNVPSASHILGAANNGAGKSICKAVANTRRQTENCHTDQRGYKTHWRAKAELHHEEFRQAQKWTLLQQRRNGHQHTSNHVTFREEKTDVIRSIIAVSKRNMDTLSRKRQAPSCDDLVTPAKFRRMVG